MATIGAYQCEESNKYCTYSDVESVVIAKLANKRLAMNSIPLRSLCFLERAHGAL